MKLIKSFLGSLLSGCIFAWIYSCSTLSCFQIILACFALGPFLNGCLTKDWKESILAYIGFSVPIVMTLGEGLWFGMHYYYQVSVIPSIFVFVVWVWIFSTLHWLVFALIGRFVPYWSLPFIWVALEFLYALVSLQSRFMHLGLWMPIHPISINFARIGGVYTLSFLIVLINVFVWSIWRNRGQFRPRQTIGFLCSFVFILLVGMTNLLMPTHVEKLDRTWRIALLQPNRPIEQEETSAHVQRRLDVLFEMSKEALKKGVDLIIWPSSTLYQYQHTLFTDLFRKLASKEPEKLRVNFGVTRIIQDKNSLSKQNVVYMVNGAGVEKGTYVKRILTPFSEYIPFRIIDILDLESSIGYRKAKDNDNIFHFKGLRWSTPICIEIFYSELLREYIQSGARFFIHLSNDSVYGTSKFPDYLLRIACFRAMELGVPILRETISGISASIDYHGRVLDRLASGKKDIMYVNMTTCESMSLYASIGDIFSYLCVIISILVLLSTRKRSAFGR